MELAINKRLFPIRCDDDGYVYAKYIDSKNCNIEIVKTLLKKKEVDFKLEEISNRNRKWYLIKVLAGAYPDILNFIDSHKHLGYSGKWLS